MKSLAFSIFILSLAGYVLSHRSSSSSSSSDSVPVRVSVSYSSSAELPKSSESSESESWQVPEGGDVADYDMQNAIENVGSVNLPKLPDLKGDHEHLRYENGVFIEIPYNGSSMDSSGSHQVQEDDLPGPAPDPDLIAELAAIGNHYRPDLRSSSSSESHLQPFSSSSSESSEVEVYKLIGDSDSNSNENNTFSIDTQILSVNGSVITVNSTVNGTVPDSSSSSSEAQNTNEVLLDAQQTVQFWNDMVGKMKSKKHHRRRQRRFVDSNVEDDQYDDSIIYTGKRSRIFKKRK